MEKNFRKRFSLYVSDKETIEWLNAQKNISLSVNTLIRKFAVNHPNQDYIQYLSDSVSDNNNFQQKPPQKQIEKFELEDKKSNPTSSKTEPKHILEKAEAPNNQADIAGNSIFENM